MSQLFELVYTSLCAENGRADDVQQILETSHRNNPILGVTGLLCFDGHRYVQILEGETDTITALFERIHTDNRHHDVELLHSGAIEGRSFDDWRMAYESMPDHTLGPLAEQMAVMSFEEAEDALTAASESFGARMFALFMNEPDRMARPHKAND